MADPIIALISTYKEGKLPQGAIRSVISIAQDIVVFEGPTEGYEVEGDKTDLGRFRRFLRSNTSWPDEHTKRTAMLNDTRKLIMRGKPFWALVIDGDEILIWGEYLQDWLNVLEPGYPHSEENLVPIKRTEAAWKAYADGAVGPYADIAPSRLYHSSFVAEYRVGAWGITTTDGKEGYLDHRESERPPVYGEPHIHHRPYLRRHERASLRLSAYEGEEQRHVRMLNERMGKGAESDN